MWTLNGFQGPVYWPNPGKTAPFTSYIRGTTTFPPPEARTSSTDPGLFSSSGVAGGNAFVDALETLPGKEIQIPVVAWLSDLKVAGSNEGRRFGLTGVVSARVCAAIYGNKSTDITKTSDPSDCDGVGTPADASGGLYQVEKDWWDGTTGPNKRYGLWVDPVAFATISPVGPPSTTCPTWDVKCTLGTLSLQLYK